MHSDTIIIIIMELPTVYFKGPHVNFLNYDVFLSLKVTGCCFFNISKQDGP